MVGKRQDLSEDYPVLRPGEYGKSHRDGKWYCRVPQSEGFYAGMGNLSGHEITEHEDGTITVSPSILITGHHGRQWHGYLQKGIWTEV